MIIFPAIDLKGGRVVRLEQGRADRETVYGEHPGEQAAIWKAAGAEWIHVVDLDGAFTGTPANRDALRRITGHGVKVQLGGGIRTAEAVQQALDYGVSRVVVGTRAAIDPEFMKTLVRQFGPEVIAVGIDARDGKVAIKGWVDVLDIEATALARRMEECGLRYVIYTDISRDGMLGGPNLDAQEAMLRETGLEVIASGGVGALKDLKALDGIRQNANGDRGLHGVIVGKALYDGRLKLEEALALF